MGVRYGVPDEQMEQIPQEGPLVVVANHPLGALEGLLLINLLRKVRPDTKVLANFLLQRIPEMREHIISVDPFGRAASTKYNVAPLREGIRWLKSGGVLGIFPSGVVSHLRLRQRAITDPPWREAVGRLIQLAKTPVLPVFFEGRNGLAFQLAGLVHPRLRTIMLPRAFLKLKNRTIGVRVGEVIPFTKLETFATPKDMLSYVRMRTYILGGDGSRRSSNRLASIRQREKDHQPIIDPVPPDRLEADLNTLPDRQLLMSSGEYQVWWANASQMPNLMNELGRLREVAFRTAGEGTGTPKDVDPYDYHYLHLLVWNKDTRELVGAYRLGQTDKILEEHGPDGLFTHEYYEFDREFLDHLNPALELGRSFVRPEYQRQHSPLALLWRGVGAFVVQNPQYRRLFGLVSISNEYQSVSKQMMIAFLKLHAHLPSLARLTRSRRPPRLQPRHDIDKCSHLISNIDEISSLVSGIEEDRKGVPVLLRQYLRLNAKFLSCNVLPSFSDMWAGLMLVDLIDTDRRILDRHLGKEGAATFLEYHHAHTTSCPP